MKRLSYDLSVTDVTLSQYVQNAPTFRSDIKAIASNAVVSLDFRSDGTVSGTIFVDNLSIPNLQATVNAITAFINSKFPSSTGTYLYQNAEERH